PLPGHGQRQRDGIPPARGASFPVRVEAGKRASRGEAVRLRGIQHGDDSTMSATKASKRPKASNPVRFSKAIVFPALCVVAFGATYGVVALTRAAPASPTGMVWIPGGEFTMGTDSDLGKPDEKPAHRVRVDGFWMDETDVTNAQFRQFVEATGYVTTAEKPVDAEEILRQSPPGTPRPPAEKLLPGALVFRPTAGPVKDLRAVSQWWK